MFGKMWGPHINFRFCNTAFKAPQARDCRAATSEPLNVKTRQKEAIPDQKKSHFCPAFSCLWGPLFGQTA